MKKHIDIKHFIIRLLIFVVVCIGTFVATILLTPMSQPRSSHNPFITALFLTFWAIVIAMILLIAETVVLYKRGKTKKLNANLLLIAIPFLIAFAIFIFIKIAALFKIITQ